MPICPKCGEEIDELIASYKEVSEYRVWLDKDGRLTWERIDVVDSEQDGSFYCPECGEELCKKQADAVAFLKSETVTSDS